MSVKIQKNRALSDILPQSKEKKLVLLTGSRQTGKTTLVKLKFPELRYINLDAPENREFVRAVSSSAWSKDIGRAVIDEAQKEPVVFEKIKYAYDAGSVDFSILLGSSQILLLKKIRESLAGRISIYELWPLMMSELYGAADSRHSRLPLVDRLFSDMSLTDIFGSVPGILWDEEDYPRLEAQKYLLNWGGMPALLNLPEQERWQWIKDYEYTYLERDLGDLARLDDLEPFRKFQKLACLRSGQLLNYSEIARDAALSVDTARRYLEYLRISYQVVLLQPFYKNITSSVVKTPKLYWVDIGLLRQLTGQKEGLTGTIYETMVVGELLKWMKTLRKDGGLYFYRTRSGLETDLLLETSAGIVGMEIKARQQVVPTDWRPLKEIAASLKHQWRAGLVIYQGNAVRKLADPEIWAVPSHRLFT